MTNEHNEHEYTGMEIAIIGMAGRFPGAPDIDAFWRNLCAGVESITQLEDHALLAAGIEQALLDDPAYVRAGAFLDDADMFDARFFGYTPRDAEIMDPQQRVFLECAWQALEHAGYASAAHKEIIGVYAGVGMNSYLFNNILTRPDVMRHISKHQIMTANDKDFLSTRVSYHLNLEGPGLVVQTACSTSLVAVHLACQSLLSGECDLALAGGVSITFPQHTGYLYHEGSIVSPDGHCRAFDAHAQGTVSGNGVGIVVLKPLATAIADHDTIYAVIKGSAINNDGSLKVGFTAPRVEGQAKVIRTAQLVADVEPETISYIETHGTGTIMGDPIEFAALQQAFARSDADAKKQFCALGSVKTNIGHLDAAAGVTGLIKTALALKWKQLPPHLHFQQPNPNIDLANSSFYINTHLTDWNVTYPRRAGVSSFGMGGTNAHAILEEAPMIETQASQKEYHVLLLSAKTDAALQIMTTNLAGYIKERPEISLADSAFTLQMGRRHFERRRFFVCKDRQEASEKLTATQALPSLWQKERPSVTFLFPGQGSQYVGMAHELYMREKPFRKWIDYCAAFLQPILHIDIRQVLYPHHTLHEDAVLRLNQTQITQCALFTIEYALAQLFIHWGISPQTMIGHSIGEYVAACLASVFSLDDALRLVAMRGQLMQEADAGAMLSLSLDEKQLRPLLTEHLELAAINGPTFCVVAGPLDEIAALEQIAVQQGIQCRRLHTSHAFHSAMMTPAATSFSTYIQNIPLKPPAIPFISNVTGTWITNEEAVDPRYWADQMVKTVQCSRGIQEIVKSEEPHILLEVGPGLTLGTFARQHAIAGKDSVLQSIRHPHAPSSDQYIFLQALGNLWSQGISVDWQLYYASEQRGRVALPTYPFQRDRFWIEPAIGPAEQTESDHPHRASDNTRIASDEMNHPVHYRPDLTTTYQGPKNEIEQGIAAIWESMLGIHDPGIHDNFFELGGHSLLATQIIARLCQRFTIELPQHILFEMPTIALLAREIERRQLAALTDDTLLQLLEEIQQLSSEEASQLLQEEQ